MPGACACALCGQWEHDLREGRGIAVYDRGRCRYEGEWHVDHRHGRGLETLRDGSRYAGDYVGDIREGQYVYLPIDSSLHAYGV